MYKPIVQYEIWILLFFSTLFVSLLFINTLVSVIGAEYSNLWENKDRYGLMETTQLYADHMDTCPPKIPSGTCVYIVSQTTETTFEDKVEDFQAQTQIQIGELQETVDKIENKMNQILEKLDEQDRKSVV